MDEGETPMTAPKYVFLFIGDGMTYPQFQATSAFLSINKDVITSYSIHYTKLYENS